MKEKKKVPELRFKGFEGEWVKQELSEVANIGRGKSKHRPRDADFLYGGKYPFIQTGDIRNAGTYLNSYSQTYSEEGLKQSKLWNENTLCITIAANIAETSILKIKACFPDSIIGLIPKDNKSAVLFVKAIFDKFKIEIQGESQGIAQANLNQEKLSKLTFHFPHIDEQNKIASFLTAVDEKLHALKKKKSILEAYKKGVMQQIFSQELRFKDEDGKDFPDWEEKALNDIAQIFDGTHQTPNYVESGIPFYSVEQVTANNFGSTKYISTSVFDQEKVRLERGNILMTKIGDIGTSKLIDWDVCASFYVSLALIKLFAGNSSHYINQFIKTDFFQKELWNRTIHVAFPKKINLGEIGNCLIMRPSIAEQNKIGAFLEAIDERIDKCTSQLAIMENWKKGLLQKMFV